MATEAIGHLSILAGEIGQGPGIVTLDPYRDSGDQRKFAQR